MNALADLLIQYKALEFGDFTLASGAKSKYYVDVKTAVTHPDFLAQIAQEIAQRYELMLLPGWLSAACRLPLPFPLRQKNRLRLSGPRKKITARRTSSSGT